MSISIISGNIFNTQCDYIVNPVNCVGVMGAGLALEFKIRYPDMFSKYENICKKGMLDIGMLWIYKSENKNILNFPTKKHWRHPSKIEYLELGLEKFRSTCNEKGITSIAFPLLGGGKGGLDPELSKNTMFHYLNDLNIKIEIYTYAEMVKDDFFESFKRKITSKPPNIVATESKVNKKYVDIIFNELINGTTCQLSQLTRLDGIGVKTIEKLYFYSTTITPDGNTLF